MKENEKIANIISKNIFKKNKKEILKNAKQRKLDLVILDSHGKTYTLEFKNKYRLKRVAPLFIMLLILLSGCTAPVDHPTNPCVEPYRDSASCKNAGWKCYRHRGFRINGNFCMLNEYNGNIND